MPVTRHCGSGLVSRQGRRAAPGFSITATNAGAAAQPFRDKAAPTPSAPTADQRSTAVVTVIVIVAVVHGPIMAALPVAAAFPVSPAFPVTSGLLATPLFAAPVAAVVMPAVVIVGQQRGRLCIGHAGHCGPWVAGRLQRCLNGRGGHHGRLHLCCRRRAHRREREQAEQHQPCDMYFHERSQPLITIEPSGQQVVGEPCLAYRYLSVPPT